MQYFTILLVTPPLTQLNTNYPATSYLKGFLKKNGYQAYQADLGIEMINRIFSRRGLQQVFEVALQKHTTLSRNAQRMAAMQQAYINTIEPVITFLQNRDNTIAYRICSDNFLPRASRFDTLGELEWAFGELGINDQARYIATLYIEDIGDFIIETISPHFGFSRYAESLATAAKSFDTLHDSLQLAPDIIDTTMLDVLHQHIERTKPDVVGFSVPFPGNVYGAFRCAQYIKQHFPHIRTIMGGGYVNTELRTLAEPRVFDYMDFVTLDDGERPLLCLLEYFVQKRDISQLKRTFTLQNQSVVLVNGCPEGDIPHALTGTPDYGDLLLDTYLSFLEVPNPMYRLWNDGRWNKITVAHGCYWAKCSFCDISLDYIKRFDIVPSAALVDKIEQIVAQTRQTGFHLVDEAAPPQGLKKMAIELLRRGTNITWWGNIRFERNFTADLCRLLAASGCIAITGGLEVASDRLLAMMKKGVSIAQVSQVTRNFTQAGVLVHAYLMYGFPTQTAQETIDSLEVVRQLFKHNLIQSGYWHRFVMTEHSEIGLEPHRYNVQANNYKLGTFANNDVPHLDVKGTNHEQFGSGLHKAVYNYMHGIGIDEKATQWFDFRVPPVTMPHNFVANALNEIQPTDDQKMSLTLVWLPQALERQRISPKERHKGDTKLVVTSLLKNTSMYVSDKHADFLQQITTLAWIKNDNLPTLADVKDLCVQHTGLSLETFMQTSEWKKIRQAGLLLV